MSLDLLSTQTLAGHGQQAAIVDATGVSNYAQLAGSVTHLSEAWQCLPPERILLSTERLHAMTAALLSIVQSQHVAIPTAPDAQAADIAAVANTSFAKQHWVDDGSHPLTSHLEVIHQNGETHPLLTHLHATGRSGLVLFTSGSSGRSKTILHDFGRLLESMLPSKPGPARKTLLLMHPDHIGGLDILFKSLATGSTLYVPPQRDIETVGAWIEQHAIEVLPATPTFLRLALLQGLFERHDCRSLRIIPYGAEIMPPELLRSLQAALPGVTLRATFGTTETGTLRLRNKATAGTLLYPDTSITPMRVVDGELWVKSPATLLGYLDANHARIDTDGWLATGDRAEISTDGGIRITGRSNKLINVGGEKVDTSEVENALLQIAGIVSARVSAKPHPLTGNVLTAEIVAAPAYQKHSLSDWKQIIRRELSATLPRWKIPASIQLTTSPANPGPRLKELSRFE